MYGWENALYANGLMSPWANAWGAQPQTIADTIVRKQIAPSMGVDGGGSFGGYSTPGDPGAAAQTSQATKDRVADSLSSSLAGIAGKTALGVGSALAAGMPTGMVGDAVVGSIASPSSLAGVSGRSIDAALGTQPQGFLGRTIANWGVPTLGAIVGGPIGGLMGSMLGGVVTDAVADAMDARNAEALRDDVESKKGYFSGRTAVADMQSAMDKVNAVQDSVARPVDKVNAVRGIAGLSPIGYSPKSMSLGGMEAGTPGSKSYGGWGNVGGPEGGARSVDRGYGPSMGGFAGLGIGNPSSYGGRASSSSGSSGGNGPGGRGSSGGGGYGGHAGGKDGSSSGFGR